MGQEAVCEVFERAPVDRREQLEVLTAVARPACSVRPGGRGNRLRSRMHRDRLELGTDAGGRAQARQVGREAVRGVDHGVDVPRSPEPAALAQPRLGRRKGRQRGCEARIAAGEFRPFERQAESGPAGAERTGHGEDVARTGARTGLQVAGPDFADGGDREERRPAPALMSPPAIAQRVRAASAAIPS